MRTRHQNWPNGERGAENDASMSEFRARRPSSYQRNCDGTATLTWSLAYVETDPAEADAEIIVENLLHGQYERPLRVLALNADEGWARDVSEAIAPKVSDVAEHEGRELTSGHEFNPDRSIVGLFVSVPGTLFAVDGARVARRIEGQCRLAVRAHQICVAVRQPRRRVCQQRA